MGKFGENWVTKINDNLSIRNLTRTKTIVSNVCGYYDTNSKNARPASYDIANEPVARKSYVIMPTQVIMKNLSRILQ